MSTQYPTVVCRCTTVTFHFISLVLLLSVEVLIFCKGTEREFQYLIMHSISPSILALKAFNMANSD